MLLIGYTISWIVATILGGYIIRKRDDNPRYKGILFGWGFVIALYLFLSITDFLYSKGIQNEMRYALWMGWDILVLYTAYITIATIYNDKENNNAE